MAVFRVIGINYFLPSAGPGGLGMTIATLSYPPAIALLGSDLPALLCAQGQLQDSFLADAVGGVEN